MSKKTTAQTPTDEEILSYNSVPLEVAAKYIGWSSCNIAFALQQERAPFGVAVQTGENDETGRPTWSYNISPGQLKAYKRGELEAWKLSSLMKVLACEVNEIINQQIGDILVSYFTSRRQAS